MQIINIDLHAWFEDGHDPTREEVDKITSDIVDVLSREGRAGEVKTIVAPEPEVFDLDLQVRGAAAEYVVNAWYPRTREWELHGSYIRSR